MLDQNILVGVDLSDRDYFKKAQETARLRLQRLICSRNRPTSRS